MSRHQYGSTASAVQQHDEDRGDGRGQEQGPEATEAVAEEEEHRGRVPRSPPLTPEPEGMAGAPSPPARLAGGVVRRASLPVGALDRDQRPAIRSVTVLVQVSAVSDTTRGYW